MAAPRVPGPGPPRVAAVRYNTDAGGWRKRRRARRKRSSKPAPGGQGAGGREEGTRLTGEGVVVDKRERKYERSRVKRTNRQPRPLASQRSADVYDGDRGRGRENGGGRTGRETVNEYKREEEARCETREKRRRREERRKYIYICMYFCGNSCPTESR